MTKNFNISCILLFLLFLWSADVGSIFNPLEYSERQSLDTMLEDYNSTSIVSRIVVPLYFCITVLLFAASKRAKVQLFNSPSIPIYIAVLYFLLLLSVLVSNTPEITIRRSIFQLLLIMAIVFNVFVVSNIRKVYWTLIAALSVIVLADLFFLMFVPSAFRPGNMLEFKGFHTDKNTAGHTLALAAICFLYGLTSQKNTLFVKISLVGLFVSSICLLSITGSKTSIGIFAIFGVVSLFIFRKTTWRIICFLSIYVSCVTLSTKWIFIENNPEIFTNRGTIWNFLNQFVIERLFTGFGYASFWAVGEYSPNLRYGEGFIQRINTAHNGYIDLLLAFGLIGFTIVVITTVFPILNVARLSSKHFIAHYILLAFFIGNLTETFFLYYSHTIWISFLVVLIATYRDSRFKNRQRRKSRKKKRKRKSQSAGLAEVDTIKIDVVL